MGECSTSFTKKKFHRQEIDGLKVLTPMVEDPSSQQEEILWQEKKQKKEEKYVIPWPPSKEEISELEKEDVDMKLEIKEKKEEKEKKIMVKEEVPTCEECHAEVKEDDRACPKCGYYRPRPGETFDISKVKFNLPDMLASRLPPTKRAENKHDMPFPLAHGADLTKSREADEWILNHLPIKEEEKKKLLDELIKEKKEEKVKELIQEKQEKREEFLSQREQERVSRKIPVTSTTPITSTKKPRPERHSVKYIPSLTSISEKQS